MKNQMLPGIALITVIAAATRHPPRPGNGRAAVDAQPRGDGKIAAALRAGQHVRARKARPLRGAPAPGAVL